MLSNYIKISKYQFIDNLKSKWVILFTLFILLFTYALVAFTSNSTKVLFSMINMIVILIPLVCLIFGTVYIYKSENYIKFLLTQPIERNIIYNGLFTGLAFSLILGFLFGTLIPIVANFNLFIDNISLISAVIFGGITQILIFTSIAFVIAFIFNDKLKGLGVAIFTWLVLTIIYDGIFLYILQIFQDYPLERVSLGIILMNPIDLGRILLILNFDISALMGYTGAIFENFFGNIFGLAVSSVSLIIWILIPYLIGKKYFSGKDF